MMHFVDPFQMGTCGFRVFDNEIIQGCGNSCDSFRQNAEKGMAVGFFSQCIGNQIQCAFLCHDFFGKKVTPQRRNMVVSAIRGNPVKAVGSSLSIFSSSTIPKASFFALPAQS